VNEDYLEYLLSLDRKLHFINSDDIAKASQARKDVEPALEKLRIKAVSKVREYLLQKVYTLRRPKTNIQIIQQNVLLKYKYFVRFLRQHGAEVYDEVRPALHALRGASPAVPPGSRL
jgi:vacuolar protein sorting-associated protein 52